VWPTLRSSTTRERSPLRACGETGHLQAQQQRPTVSLHHPDEVPLGLEEGIVMTMLRNAGSLKNDKNLICARSSSIPRQRGSTCSD
jgi:hypothetical protein